MTDLHKGNLLVQQIISKKKTKPPQFFIETQVWTPERTGMIFNNVKTVKFAINLIPRINCMLV